VRALLVAAIALAMAAALSACGEPEQVVVYKQGKYQGKPDGKSWENDPIAYGSAKWTKGDKVSWENQIKTRANGQNEYKRIYQ